MNKHDKRSRIKWLKESIRRLSEIKSPDDLPGMGVADSQREYQTVLAQLRDNMAELQALERGMI